MSKQINETSPQENVATVISATEEFLSKYKNVIFITVAAIAALILIGYSYSHFYRKPRKAEAAEQMFPSERAFQEGEFELALNGDGNNLGFNAVLKDYRSAAPKVIHLYIGVSLLHLGEYQEAIDALKKYNSKDAIMSARATANIGDGYAGLLKYNDAIRYYKKAASMADNALAASYIKKAAIMEEESGNYKAAIKLFKELSEKYPQTPEGGEAEKYISNLEIKLQEK